MFSVRVCTIVSILVVCCMNMAMGKKERRDVLSLQKTDASKAARTLLKVAPFPYVPDSANDRFQSLLDFIKKEFETAYPNVNLMLRPMNDTNGFYDVPTLAQWLASNGNGYDIVEVDTVLLGDLVNAGLLTPQLVLDQNRADWHPAAASSVQYNQAVYGYPHLLCANFLFTRDDHTAKATNIDQLVAALGNIPTYTRRLVGNLDSSWDLPGKWINSYQSSLDGLSDMTSFALHAYQNASFDATRKLARLCDRIPSENHCLDGTFKNAYDLPAILFGQQQATAMFGYSERLFFVLKNGQPEDYNNVKMTPLPTGTKHKLPIFTTDAYVFRRNMSLDVLSMARAFVEFMATPKMQAAFVASGDSPYPKTLPRYLLPISQSAYDEPLLATDRFYQTYFRGLNGFSLPGTGFYTTRKDLYATLMQHIK